MADVRADLEGTLDRVIGRLTRPGAPREAKAIALDARRLRTLVGNWRTIAPTEEALKEMSVRVEQLARSAEAAVPPEETPIPEGLRSPAPSAPPNASPRSPAPSPKPAVGPSARPERSASEPSPARPERSVSEPSPARLERSVSEPSPARTAPPRADSAPAPPRQAPPARSASEWDEPPSLIVPARTLLGSLDEPTRAAPIATMVQAGEERAAARGAADRARAASAARAPAEAASALASSARSNGPLDPERPRTLPDLDISGIAQLLEDSPPVGFDDTLETARPTIARSTRVDFDSIGRRPASEPPPRARPSPTPANGRRRAEAATSADPSKITGRLSRILVDADNESDVTGAPVVPTGDDAGRASMRPSSSPPNASRSDKPLIAVRPLPAPEVLDKRLVLLTEPFSARADAYRALRRKLSGPGAPRTIAISSAQTEEGKTSCAVNLALAFRETSSERVLLLEANLRAPALAKLFGFEPPVCFAKQMAKNRDSARASWTVAEQFEPLHVLAVDPSSKTSPLLDPVAFANALEQLVEAGYDHIIVDTPPALGGSDVNLIADAVDGIVIVAWIKKSKRSLVKKAIEQLKPATILGVVTLEG